MRKFIWLIALAAIGAALPVQGQDSSACGCVDVVLVVDDTGSMGGAINNLKAGLSNIVAVANTVSGGDSRFALISFSDSIDVDRPFTNEFVVIQAAVNALEASGGENLPEASDEALKLVVTGSASSTCTVNTPAGPLGNFRSACIKIAVLVTDALPGGCDDTFVTGVDDVNAATVATSAAAAGIRISAIQVGGAGAGELADIMKNYADVTGGTYSLTPASGEGAGNAITGILQRCGQYTPPETFLPTTKPALHNDCITREARYWFTHAYSENINCATLYRAIGASDNGLQLGFLGLPVDFRNDDSVKDGADALIEALGLYWRSLGRTGEPNGTQSAKQAGSTLCKERKRLSIELISAIANNALLGTVPGNCTYRLGSVDVNFPTDLIELAGQAAAGEDLVAVRAMTVLLRKFNRSGVRQNFLLGLEECSGMKTKFLRTVARDPSTIRTCPGFNDTCDSAKSIITFPFTDSVNLLKYSNQVSGPVCADGGREAVWRISPPVAAPGRRFQVETFGSNFDTVISVLQGSCNPLDGIACNDDAPGRAVKQSSLSFTADGTNTYFIVVDGVAEAIGRLKLRVISY